MQIIKPRVIESLKITAFYSGNRGFYCSMYPTSATLSTLVSHFKPVPQLGDKLVPPALMHVTLMYSNEPVPMEDLPWVQRDVVIPAVAIGYDFFCKPHATEGAVVMLLDSKGLEDYHESLATLADYTWDEFKPHLTLAYDMDPTEAAILISALSAMPLPQGLAFTAPVFEDKS